MNKVVEADFFPQTPETVKERVRILIIDDDHAFTRSAKLALEKARDYFVCEENDAAKAHQTARRFKPDLILLDIAIPQTDGGEVAARIQSDPGLRRVPVVFLTALVTKAETKSGLWIEGHPYLAKPISLAELIEGIEENLPWRARSVHR